MKQKMRCDFWQSAHRSITHSLYGMEAIQWNIVCILLKVNWIPDEAKQSSTWRELVNALVYG